MILTVWAITQWSVVKTLATKFYICTIKIIKYNIQVEDNFNSTING